MAHSRLLAFWTLDRYHKQQEFYAWLREVKEVDPENQPPKELEDLFSDFAEDFNTVTLPDKKYYNLEGWEAKQMKKRKAAGAAAAEPTVTSIVDDERVLQSRQVKVSDLPVGPLSRRSLQASNKAINLSLSVNLSLSSSLFQHLARALSLSPSRTLCFSLFLSTPTSLSISLSLSSSACMIDLRATSHAHSIVRAAVTVVSAVMLTDNHKHTPWSLPPTPYSGARWACRGRSCLKCSALCENARTPL
jgi:hypothetical protein